MYGATTMTRCSFVLLVTIYATTVAGQGRYSRGGHSLPFPNAPAGRSYRRGGYGVGRERSSPYTPVSTYPGTSRRGGPPSTFPGPGSPYNTQNLLAPSPPLAFTIPPEKLREAGELSKYSQPGGHPPPASGQYYGQQSRAPSPYHGYGRSGGYAGRGRARYAPTAAKPTSYGAAPPVRGTVAGPSAYGSRGNYRAAAAPPRTSADTFPVQASSSPYAKYSRSSAGPTVNLGNVQTGAVPLGATKDDEVSVRLSRLLPFPNLQGLSQPVNVGGFQLPLIRPPVDYVGAENSVQELIRDLSITCNTLCRSMEVKAVFTYQYGTKLYITTFGPHSKHDNCFFEGRNLDKAYFSIAMYGCNTRELIDSDEVRFTNSLVVQVTKPNGVTKVENYPIACGITKLARDDIIKPVEKILNERSQGTPPHIAIPNHCIHVDEVKNQLYDKPPGESCLLNEQCPLNAMCTHEAGMRKCVCEPGYMPYNGYCMHVPRNGDPCREQNDCDRPGALSYTCSQYNVCEIRSSYGDFCADNSDCGSAQMVCDITARKCRCHPQSQGCTSLIVAK